MYQIYKDARNKSWEVLISCNINTLPVNLMIIAKHYRIKIVKYSESKYVQGLNIPDTDGFSIYRKVLRNHIIYYNDAVENKARIRFTIAHELGHCLLGHNINGHTHYRNSEIDDPSNPDETAANVFARDILMPATILRSLNVTSAEDISKICNVSMQSAEIRFNRLLELNKRNMYNRHPLEKQVYNQFSEYIEKECKLWNSSHSSKKINLKT